MEHILRTILEALHPVDLAMVDAWLRGATDIHK